MFCYLCKFANDLFYIFPDPNLIWKGYACSMSAGYDVGCVLIFFWNGIRLEHDVIVTDMNNILCDHKNSCKSVYEQ